MGDILTGFGDGSAWLPNPHFWRFWPVLAVLARLAAGPPRIGLRHKVSGHFQNENFENFHFDALFGPFLKWPKLGEKPGNFGSLLKRLTVKIRFFKIFIFGQPK